MYCIVIFISTINLEKKVSFFRLTTESILVKFDRINVEDQHCAKFSFEDYNSNK